MTKLAFQRVVLKLSGDILKGDQPNGIDFNTVARIVSEAAPAIRDGLQLSVVVGGGNLFRGSEAVELGYHRLTADNMGMLSTVINALALQNGFENIDIQTRVMSAVTITEMVEPFIRRRAIRHLEKGRVVIFAAGTGNPYFTTDTAAALRASQVGADLILKGTKVDGIYDMDPNTNDNAKMFESIDYMDVLKRGLRVMDLTAITFCRDFNITVKVFNVLTHGNLKKVLYGNTIGTTVSEEVN
ncbi:UMP kinase [Calditrichota bacterium]